MDAAIRADCNREPTPKRWTAEQYLRMAETGIFAEDGSVELLDGEIVERMSPIGIRHAECLFRVNRWLFAALPAGFEVLAGTIQASAWDVPEPDLTVVRKPIEQFASYPTPGDIALVIEISDSSLGLDRTRKALIYGAAGIAEYWILNLRDRQLEVHREPTGEGFAFVRRFGNSATVRPLFAEIDVVVAELLPRGKPEA